MFISVASERATNRVADDINLGIARSKEELESAFRLIYMSYIRAGLQQPNDVGMRLTRYHFLESTDVFTAKLGDRTISTSSLIPDSQLGLPAESMYRDEIDEIRQSGTVLAEVGCLADRRERPNRFIQVFRELSKLITQTAVARGCGGLIAATHPRHARFYIRQLGFRKRGEIRECPYVQGNPAVLLYLDFNAIQRTELHEHFFGSPYPPQELSPFVWSAETRKYFHAIFERISAIEKSPLN